MPVDQQVEGLLQPADVQFARHVDGAYDVRGDLRRDLVQHPVPTLRGQQSLTFPVAVLAEQLGQESTLLLIGQLCYLFADTRHRVLRPLSIQGSYN
ncbi:hypothetical protein GCM10009779_53140 [Polymorphospora rubra]|uniref:Uncharacterized protein n=1 Tax=Polymorphospora rubra TaxID=338584 RepID=A0A810N4M6_9ACTN|nr:hypothetical protein Prubr_36740 [Polymorphospora rubra]